MDINKARELVRDIGALKPEEYGLKTQELCQWLFKVAQVIAPESLSIPNLMGGKICELAQIHILAEFGKSDWSTVPEARETIALDPHCSEKLQEWRVLLPNGQEIRVAQSVIDLLLAQEEIPESVKRDYDLIEHYGKLQRVRKQLFELGILYEDMRSIFRSK